jgi:hypothetical protein
MRARITDAETISALSPISVVGYLRARGWTPYSEASGRFSVWINSIHPDAEVVVPFKRTASDYVSVLSVLLRELENAEGRSQIDIFRDLFNSGFDLVRLAARSAATSDGSIRIGDGIRLFEEAKEIVLAAACATVRPRAVFHSRKPQQAVEYMDRARLGQTEHGSYVLTILSPVAPLLNAYSDTDLFPGEPFEREVVKTLANSLNLAVSAAESSSLQGDFAPFQDAVAGGVSANLCEAIAGLHEMSEANEIGITFTWSQNRPAPPPSTTPSQIVVTRDVVPAIVEAARLFRERDTLQDCVVQGPVVRLERAEGAREGRVTIFATIEDAPRKVTVVLPEDAYEVATRAHAQFQPVKVIGNVRREGRSYALHGPSGFTIAIEEDEG